MTELAAPYIVAQTPVAETPAVYTLAQLQSLKAQWIATYAADIDGWMLVARELGTPMTFTHGWDGLKGYQFHVGNVTVELYERDGEYLTEAKKYNHITRLHIYLGMRQKRVVYWFIDDAGTKEDNFIVEGSWMITVKPFIAKAREAAKRRELEAEAVEYDRLYKQLLIGERV
jgi:hypothetical protein